MPLTRRSLLKFAGLAPSAKLIGIQLAHAEDRDFQHALTLFSDIKYGPDFKHFDYVNPAAPKAGRVRFGIIGSFDNLNPYTYKGETAGAANNETLTSSSLDEPATKYGLVAESMWHPQDRSLVVYRLRPEARFHDGVAMTPEDVIWSLEALRAAHPFYNAYYKNIAKAEQTGEREVTFTFSVAGNRELPSITGDLPVLPKHWWTGTDAQGKPRNIQETTLEVPLSSGSYKAVEVKPGVSFKLKRVPDYWGLDLPVNVGTDNFDEIEYVYFRDTNVAFEALKGDQYDWRLETSAKAWATQYNFPAIAKGRVIKEQIATKNVEGMQCWCLNLRRDKFKDARVRRALNLAFDFEWSNANLFFGQYTRSRSFFNKSDMEAQGLPDADELAILEPLRGKIPDAVFTAPYANPVNATPQDRRKHLREAAGLLQQAGWTITQDGARSSLQNAKGEKFEVEFLFDSPLFERIALPYQQQLQLLGISATIKTPDSAQYERRMKSFDFDIAVAKWPQSQSPGNEQRELWGSAAASHEGSRNFAGIADPAIDQIIEKIAFAPDRPKLVAACKALDRVLMANDFVVPMWFLAASRIARWDRFSYQSIPDFALGFPSTWWWDEEKAKAVAAKA